MGKKLFITWIFFVVCVYFAEAQIPGQAEDISPLLVGESLPNTELTSVDGSKHEILELAAKKPTVFLVYRGGWCPFCNAHLAEIQGVQSDIVELGYQILAVSPDSPENLINTVDDKQLSYRLFSDSNCDFIKAAGIAFQAPERSAERLVDWSGGLNEGLLPVPSVFVTDREGKILFEYINPDYRTRISADLLIAVLKSLAI